MKQHSVLMNIVAYLVILSALGNKHAASSCDWMPCFTEYYNIVFTNISSNEACPVFVDTWRCIYQLTDCIFEPALDQHKIELTQKSMEYNCSIPEEPTTPATTQPPIGHCPSKLSHLPLLPIQNLSMADVASNPRTRGLCPKFDDSETPTRHCSVYTYSHILPFNNDTIKSFTLPGSYYILNHHRGVKIEIFTAVSDIKSFHASVQKIKVTIQSPNCTLGAVFNYTATTSDELKADLTTDEPIIESLYNPVQLNVNSDKTVASIIVPWLGLTVVIRRHNSHLSIVIQMPAELAAESDGLCSTVPPHSMYSASDVAIQTCNRSDYNYALQACTVHANLIAIVSLETSVTYSYTCTYDILQASSYELLPLYLAIWSDLEALPSKGIYIRPNPYDPPAIPPININIHPSSTSPTTTTTTTTTSTSSTSSTTYVHIVTTSAANTPTSAVMNAFPEYSSAESSFKRPGILLVFSLCLCLLLTIMLS